MAFKTPGVLAASSSLFINAYLDRQRPRDGVWSFSNGPERRRIKSRALVVCEQRQKQMDSSWRKQDSGLEPKPRVLFLVRAVCPTHAQLRRMLQWRQDCKTCTALDVDFVCSVDVTHNRLFRAARAERLREDPIQAEYYRPKQAAAGGSGSEKPAETASDVKKQNGEEKPPVVLPPQHQLQGFPHQEIAKTTKDQEEKSGQDSEDEDRDFTTDILPSHAQLRCVLGKDLHEYNCIDIEFGTSYGHGWTEMRRHIHGFQGTVPGRRGCCSWAWGMHNECVLDAIRWRVGEKGRAGKLGGAVLPVAHLRDLASPRTSNTQAKSTANPGTRPVEGLSFQEAATKRSTTDLSEAVLTYYDQIWLFEEDVGWSGENVVRDLIEKYYEDPSDLLTAWYEYYEEQTPPKWCWRTSRTAAFTRRTDGLHRGRASSCEHVQRFSKRFLQELAEWAAAGAVAWSEMSTPTVCLAGMERKEKPLLCGLFGHDTVGEVFSWDGRLSEAAWKNVVERDAKKGSGYDGKGKMYHALKW
ncbi:unnamed protein product [Amoebophrya sp. A120]|nr:unnamed protein product [Amoebophrya sp. A120]|eukprot:GSA120T00012725001.1